MSVKPDWGKQGVVAAYVIGIPAVIMAVLACVRPPDPAHPMKFDIFESQISFSISVRSFVLGLIAVSAICFWIWRFFNRQRSSKITIHSALYGASETSDRDVTETLRRAIKQRDAVAFWIDNKAFGFDPKIGQPKTLKVVLNRPMF